MEVEELLRSWDHDHSVILGKLDYISKTLQQRQDLSKAELLPRAQQPTQVSAPSTPPHHEVYRGQPEGPHISSPLSGEAALWLKQHDPSIISACKSATAGEVLAAKAAIDAVCARHGLERSDLQAHLDIFGLDVETVDEDAVNVKKMLQELADDEGWTVSYNHGLRVLYRHLRNTKVHSVKMQAEFEAPMWHVMALMVEFDLTSTWNTHMQDTVILHSELPLLTCIYGGLWTPLLLFDTVAKAEAFDIGLEDRSVLARLSNLSDAEVELYGPLPPAHKKRRRATIGSGSCFRLEPLPPGPDGKHRTRATAMAHINPHLPFVPAFLVNFILRVASPFAYRMMSKVLKELFKEPDSIFNQRIASRPEVYQMCKERTKQLMMYHYGIHIDI